MVMKKQHHGSKENKWEWSKGVSTQEGITSVGRLYAEELGDGTASDGLGKEVPLEESPS